MLAARRLQQLLIQLVRRLTNIVRDGGVGRAMQPRGVSVCLSGTGADAESQMSA